MNTFTISQPCMRLIKNNNVVPFKSKNAYGALVYQPINNQIDMLVHQLKVDPEKVPQRSLSGSTIKEARRTVSNRINNLVSSLYSMIYKDSMLGCNNRAALDKDKVEFFIDSCKSGSPLGYMNLDIDSFGNYNNVYGHFNGDKALKAFVNIVGSVIERSGYEAELYREGGEEFVVLIRNAKRENVADLAYKIKDAVEIKTQEYTNLVELHPMGLPEAFTVSIGYAIAEAPEKAQEIIDSYNNSLINKSKSGQLFRDTFDQYFIQTLKKTSDDALYASKLIKGRNQVTSYKEIIDNDQYKQFLESARKIAADFRVKAQEMATFAINQLKPAFIPKN